MYRAELLKLRTVRSPWLAVLVAAVGMVFMQALTLVFINLPSIAEELTSQGVDASPLSDPSAAAFQRGVLNLLGQGPGGMSTVSLTAAAVMILGVLAGTMDYRTGGIVPTLLVEPRRLRVLAGKAGAVTTFAAVIAALLVVLTALGLFAVVSTTDGGSVGLDAVEILAVWGRGLLVLVLLALLGFAIGTLVRSQVTGILVVCALLLVEPIVQAVATMISPTASPTAWLPMTLSSVASTGQSATEVLGGTAAMGPGPALLLLTVWVVTLLGAAALAVRRRDIA